MKRAFIIVILVLISIAFCLQAFAGYRTELRRATSRGGMYDLKTGNAKLLWSATLFTDDYRRAFAEKHIKIKYLNTVEAAVYMGEQENEQAREWEVILAMYTPKAYKEFSMEKDSFWETFLTTEFGEDVQPLSIEEIERTPYWDVMFHFLERWAKLYRITFPKAALGKKATITMRSVVGDDHLKLKVRPASK